METKHFALALSGFLLTAVSSSAQTVHTFRSNATWTVSHVDGHRTLEIPAMPVCVNDRIPATCPMTGPVIDYNHPGQYWFADLSRIPGAQWIWDPLTIARNTSAEDDEIVVFKAFDLPDCARQGSFAGEIFIAADDFARVFVNGRVVGEIGSVDVYFPDAFDAQNQLTRFDLSQYLVKGTNVIEIEAMNGDFGICQNCSYSMVPAAVTFGGTLGCS
jgi:hypothetical protein